MITTIRNRHIDIHRRSQKFDFAPLDDFDLIGEIDVTMSSFDPALERALAQLNDDERELLYLSVMEGYSTGEIAKLTKRPRGTILSMLHRSKKKLQKLLTLSAGARSR